MLTLLQIGWLPAEIIKRASINITSAPLEIMTLSFTAMAMSICIFLLNHPQDIYTRIYIQASRAPSTNDMSAILGSASPLFWLRTHPDFAIPTTRINSASRKKYDRGPVKVYTLCLTLGPLISGGLHLLAWNLLLSGLFGGWLHLLPCSGQRRWVVFCSFLMFGFGTAASGKFWSGWGLVNRRVNAPGLFWGR